MADETKVTAESLRAQADELDKQAADEAVEAEKKEAKKAFAALSPEERSAVLRAKADEEKLRRLVSDPTEEQKQSTIGVDYGANGTYTYYPIPEPVHENYRQPRLLFRGKNVEHVSEDLFGRWLYRRM